MNAQNFKNSHHYSHFDDTPMKDQPKQSNQRSGYGNDFSNQKDSFLNGNENSQSNGEAISVFKEQLNKIKLLKNEVELKNQELEILHDQMLEQERQKHELEKQTDDLENMIERIQEQFNLKLTSLQEINESLSAANELLPNKLLIATQQISSQLKEISHYRAVLEKYDAEKLILIAEVTQVKEVLKSIQQNTSESRERMSSLIRENQEKTGLLMKNESELSMIKSDFKSQESQLIKYKQQIEKLEHEAVQNEERKIKQDKKISKRDRKIVEITQQYKDDAELQGKEITNLKIEGNSLKLRYDECKRALEECRKNLSQQTQFRIQAEQTFDQLSIDFQASKTRETQLKKKNESLNSRAIQLEHSMNQALLETDSLLQILVENEKQSTIFTNAKLKLHEQAYLLENLVNKMDVKQQKTNARVKQQASNLKGKQELPGKGVKESDKKRTISLSETPSDIIVSMEQNILEKMGRLKEKIIEQIKLGDLFQQRQEQTCRVTEILQEETDQLKKIGELNQLEQDNQIRALRTNYEEQIYELQENIIQLREQLKKVHLDNSQQVNQRDSKLVTLERQLADQNVLLKDNSLTLEKNTQFSHFIQALVNLVAQLHSQLHARQVDFSFLKKYLHYYIGITQTLNSSHTKCNSSQKNEKSTDKSTNLSKSHSSSINNVYRVIKKKFRKYAYVVIFCSRIRSLLNVPPSEQLTKLSENATRRVENIMVNNTLGYHSSVTEQFISQIQKTLKIDMQRDCAYQSNSYVDIKSNVNKDVAKIAKIIKQNQLFEMELAHMTQRVISLSEQTKQIENSFEEKQLDFIREKQKQIDSFLAKVAIFSQHSSQNPSEIQNGDSKYLYADHYKDKPNSNYETDLSDVSSVGKNQHLSFDSLQIELSKIINKRNSKIESQNNSTLSKSLKCPGKIVKNNKH